MQDRRGFIVLRLLPCTNAAASSPAARGTGSAGLVSRGPALAATRRDGYRWVERGRVSNWNRSS